MEKVESTLKKIGQKLKELRIKKGYKSYESFAFDFEIPRMQYWKMEKGQTNMTIKSLLTVLEIHGMTIEDFFATIEEKVNE